ncbi:uncharacterized protein PHACADRAFT_211116 [Phanerochaete carnosa HHB-10118-sp]|uniref:Uncharacterized protein n=1 Tax=Phanerochaete carnosa (strain HHB-10118-sp) TaxID=650164 RepID=K5UTX3_PHACS|nr:uncharacterized protein PHACADRAFT_211116 [Phanerochaete carnosa HHB-10118-sp]EKM53416.1 hypothetical protein PHACADRAFT_211116 [Phanerochaete carnosa HHB-10118-sp]
MSEELAAEDLSLEQMMINKWMKGYSVVRKRTTPSTAQLATMLATMLTQSSQAGWTSRPPEDDSDDEMVFKGFGSRDRKRNSLRDTAPRRAPVPEDVLAASQAPSRPSQASPRKEFSSISTDASDYGEFGLRSSQSCDTWLRKASQPTIPDDAPFSQGLPSSRLEPQGQEMQDIRLPETAELKYEDVDDSDNRDSSEGGSIACCAIDAAGFHIQVSTTIRPLSTASRERNPDTIVPPEGETRESVIVDFVTQYMRTMFKHGIILEPRHKNDIFDVLTRGWDNGRITFKSLDNCRHHVRSMYPIPDERDLPDVRRYFFRWELPYVKEEDWFKRRKRIFPLVEDPDHLGEFYSTRLGPGVLQDGQYYDRSDTSPPQGSRLCCPPRSPHYDDDDEDNKMVFRRFGYQPTESVKVDGNTASARLGARSTPVASSLAGPSRPPTARKGPSYCPDPALKATPYHSIHLLKAVSPSPESDRVHAQTTAGAAAAAPGPSLYLGEAISRDEHSDRASGQCDVDGPEQLADPYASSRISASAEFVVGPACAGLSQSVLGKRVRDVDRNSDSDNEQPRLTKRVENFLGSR